MDLFLGLNGTLMKHLLSWLESLPSRITFGSSHHVKWRACRSSGPGGQHVNKTNSRAELIISRSLLPLELQEGMKEIRVESQVHRHFVQNQEECKRKALRMMARAVHEVMPRETSVEQIKRVEGFKKVYEGKRLESKKHLSEKKSSRMAARGLRWD
jgi:peptidyl-tRNA hydrolase ICT1